jgi:hypothetical protein
MALSGGGTVETGRMAMDTASHHAMSVLEAIAGLNAKLRTF